MKLSLGSRLEGEGEGEGETRGMSGSLKLPTAEK